LNLQAGVWLPAYVFIEESNLKSAGPLLPGLHFKAQTRLWSYDPEPLKHEGEFAEIQIDTVTDQTTQPRKPARSKRSACGSAQPKTTLSITCRSWTDRALGDVDKILQTVVNNLIITNNLQIIPDVRCECF